MPSRPIRTVTSSRQKSVRPPFFSFVSHRCLNVSTICRVRFRLQTEKLYLDVCRDGRMSLSRAFFHHFGSKVYYNTNSLTQRLNIHYRLPINTPSSTLVQPHPCPSPIPRHTHLKTVPRPIIPVIPSPPSRTCESSTPTSEREFTSECRVSCNITLLQGMLAPVCCSLRRAHVMQDEQAV